jgi:hypothetical protein
LANLNESEMALFSECTPECSSKELDTADILRDGDLTPTTRSEHRYRTETAPETRLRSIHVSRLVGHTRYFFSLDTMALRSLVTQMLARSKAKT